MKIYKKGNYIYIVDNTGDIKQDHANEVKVTKSNVSNEKYTIYSDDLGLNEVEFSEIKKEDGNAYASVSAWELWYAENTGFNPAPGGSGAGTTIEVVSNFSSLPSASSNTDTFYWCENSQGTAWLPGTLGGTYYPSGLYYSNGTSWSSVTSPYNATQNEVNTGTNNDKFVTPYTFENASKWNDYTLLEDNRIGDHQWYISDLTKFQTDYPTWPGITISLQETIKQMVEFELSKTTVEETV